MKGKVLDFNLQAGEGVISGDDGQRYAFIGMEWKTREVRPASGVVVDFVIDDGKATEIYVDVRPKMHINIPSSVQDFTQSDNVFMRYYVGTLKQYVNFSGRARRSEYWYFVLFNFIVAFVINLIATPLGQIYNLAVFLPSIAVTTRRLHDTGRSGWMQLWLVFPPFIAFFFGAIAVASGNTSLGFVVIFVGIALCFWLVKYLIEDSHAGSNQYGENPKGL